MTKSNLFSLPGRPCSDLPFLVLGLVQGGEGKAALAQGGSYPLSGPQGQMAPSQPHLPSEANAGMMITAYSPPPSMPPSPTRWDLGCRARGPCERGAGESEGKAGGER